MRDGDVPLLEEDVRVRKHEVAHSRWVVLACSFGAMICGGVIYGFGIFSDHLKDEMNYSQAEIDHLAFAANIGSYLGLIAGMTFDRLGPRVTMRVGAVLNFAGFLPLYLAATHRIPAPFWTMFLYCMVWGHAANYFDCSVIGTCINNFPDNKGYATGFMKAFYGLSASILTQVHATFFEERPLEFLLFLAFLGTVGFICSFGIGFKYTPELAPVFLERLTQKSNRRFYRGYAVLILLAGYLSGIAVYSSAHKDGISHTARVILFSILICLISIVFVLPWRSEAPPKRKLLDVASAQAPSVSTALLAQPHGGYGPSDAQPQPIAIATARADSTSAAAAAEQGQLSPRAGSLKNSLPGSYAQRTLSNALAVAPDLAKELGETEDAIIAQAEAAAEAYAEQEAAAEFGLAPAAGDGDNLSLSLNANPGARETRHQPQQQPLRVQVADLTPLETFKTANFWLLSVVYLCIVAGGATIIANIAQVVRALGGTKNDTNIYVSIISIGNCLGRIMSGFLSDKLAHRVPRPLFLALASGSMGLAHIGTAFANLNSLYASVLVAGTAYGVHAAVAPAIVSEFFGLKSFGTIYNSFILPSTLASFGISAWLFSTVYEEHIHDGGQTCLGGECIRLTFLIVSVMCAVGFCCCLILTKRTLRFYRPAVTPAPPAAGPAALRSTIGPNDDLYSSDQ